MRRSLTGHSIQLRPDAERTGFPFEMEHWCRCQTRRENRA